MALADAQSLAIRKLLSKAAYDSNVAPGPPLPRSHPSPALIAKLHLECASTYTSALSLVKTTGERRRRRTSTSPERNVEVSADLRRYLADEAAFHGALSRKWLGVDAGENGKSEKGGDAVGFLAWAKKELEEMKDGWRGISAVTGDREMREAIKQKVNDELTSVGVFYKYYKKLNDSVSAYYCIVIPHQLTTLLITIASLPTSLNTNRAAVTDPCWNNGDLGQTLRTSGSSFWPWFCGTHPKTG